MNERFHIPRLKLREKTGIYAKGRARILQILDTAYDIVMSSGYASLTLREIARRCNIRNGAISYYYKTKDDLVRDLLESALAPYRDFAASVEQDETTGPEQKLRTILEMVLDDIQRETTTKFYPELWALSNHDQVVADLVDQMYAAQWEIVSRLILQVNPRISEEAARDLAIYISSTLVGLLPFIGFGKSQEGKFLRLSSFAIENLLSTVRHASHEAASAQTGS